MALQKTQSEIERELHDHWPNGSIRGVSLIIGKNETILGRELNYNTEYQSSAYSFLREQCGLDEYDLALGDAHWTAVCRLRELSRPVRLRELDRGTEAVRNLTESTDVATAHMRRESLYEQLSEVLEQISQAERHKEAILADIARERETEGGGRSRFSRRAC